MPKDDKRTRAKKKRKAKQAKKLKKAVEWSEEQEKQYQAKWDFWKELSPDIIELTPEVAELSKLDVIPPKGEGKAYYGICKNTETDEPFPVFIYLRPMTIEEVEAFSTKAFAENLREPMERGEVLVFRRFSDNNPNARRAGAGAGQGSLSVMKRVDDDEELGDSFLGKKPEPQAVKNKILGRTNDEVLEDAQLMIEQLELVRKRRG
jgi:hypothetical protein